MRTDTTVIGAAVWARGFRAIPHAPLNQRKQVRKEVEARTPQTPDDRFIDANTGDPIEGNHDLGHKYGHEFRREKAKAEAEGLSQPEFNERMNNPDLYQIEDPINNRGHRFEEPGND